MFDLNFVLQDKMMEVAVLWLVGGLPIFWPLLTKVVTI
jgi:hypothetical protein